MFINEIVRNTGSKDKPHMYTTIYKYILNVSS